MGDMRVQRFPEDISARRTSAAKGNSSTDEMRGGPRVHGGQETQWSREGERGSTGKRSDSNKDLGRYPSKPATLVLLYFVPKGVMTGG